MWYRLISLAWSVGRVLPADGGGGRETRDDASIWGGGTPFQGRDGQSSNRGRASLKCGRLHALRVSMCAVADGTKDHVNVNLQARH